MGGDLVPACARGAVPPPPVLTPAPVVCRLSRGDTGRRPPHGRGECHRRQATCRPCGPTRRPS